MIHFPSGDARNLERGHFSASAGTAESRSHEPTLSNVNIHFRDATSLLLDTDLEDFRELDQMFTNFQLSLACMARYEIPLRMNQLSSFSLASSIS